MNSPTTTPKRKRGVEASLTPIKFNFNLDDDDDDDDNVASPSKSVALRFRGLAIGSDGGGGVDAVPDHELQLLPSKRVKSDEAMNDADNTSPDTTKSHATFALLPETPIPIPDVISPHLQPSSPQKKRCSPPPPQIVDPDRAALTWREDEITIYDPSDPNDDGTGINGVGFKPTPAQAHSRVLKRRQQLADYRRREESDARAKRSLRRRGAAAAVRAASEGGKKVRFMERESVKVFEEGGATA